ncbi:hypothetical protein ACWCPT_10045 [Streptomyces sp. NPDC002308]
MLDHNVVQVVVTARSEALMFSPRPIPYPRGDRPEYLRRLGLCGFTGESLQRFRQLQRGPWSAPREWRRCASSNTATPCG